MKKETKIILLTGVVYLATELITLTLRTIDFRISAIVGFLTFFALTFFWCKKFSWIKSWKLLTIALFAYCVLYSVSNLKFSLLPGHLDAGTRLIGIILGFLFYKATFVFRWIICIVSLILICCTPNLYIGYLTYLSYGNFSGRTNIQLVEPLLLESQTDTLVISKNSGKIYVLDCWNTHCGNCIKAFPKYQKFFEKFKDNEDVKFYTLNVHEKHITRQTYNIPNKNGCQVPVLVARNSEALKRYGVIGVPVLLIISPEGNIVYRNSYFQEAEKVLKELLREKL